MRFPTTITRYRLEVQREHYPESVRRGLEAGRFVEPFSKVSKDPVWGWARQDNCMATDFSDADRWLFDGVAVFHLRRDQKRIPAKRFKGMLAERLSAWCEEHGRKRAPKSVRDEERDRLEFELLQGVLPSTQVTEVRWHLEEGYVLLGSHTGAVKDSLRRLMREHFGVVLVEENPLAWLSPDLCAKVERTGALSLNFGGV